MSCTNAYYFHFIFNKDIFIREENFICPYKYSIISNKGKNDACY